MIKGHFLWCIADTDLSGPQMPVRLLCRDCRAQEASAARAVSLCESLCSDLLGRSSSTCTPRAPQLYMSQTQHTSPLHPTDSQPQSYL